MLKCIIALILMPFLVSAEELSKGEKDTIFIGELKVQPSVIELAKQQDHRLDLQRVIESLDTQFTASLNSIRVFQLVERKRKEDVELEQKYAAVAVDPNDKNIAETAKAAGAKFAFLPQIDGFEDRTTSKTKKSSYTGISSTSTRRSIYLSVVVSITDTTSLKSLPDSPSIQVDSSMLPVEAIGDRIYVELAKIAATKLAQNTVALLRPPKVIDVTGDQIMINRGIESGFPVDTPIEIYAIKDVKDEDTGEIFHNEIPVGKANIVRGDAKQSFAIITGENLGIAPGAIARPLTIKRDKKTNKTRKSNKKPKASVPKRVRNENDW